MATETVSYELANLLALLNSSNFFSNDVILAIRYFEKKKIEVTPDGVILIPNELLPEALKNFGSAIRRCGTVKASDGFTAYKCENHFKDQIQKSSAALTDNKV